MRTSPETVLPPTILRHGIFRQWSSGIAATRTIRTSPITCVWAPFNTMCGLILLTACPNEAGTSPASRAYLLPMITFLLWCILLVLCWPLALLAAVLYPLIWLLLLPFRLVGIAVGGALELVKAIIFLPVRLLRGRHA